ncbi:MAG: M20/M25/M40 family metallo-hydrolase [Deltaproteobacteria bacterium]
MSTERASHQGIENRPAELLQRLLQFDTTNPPGNEAECVHFINDLLVEAGMQTTLLRPDPNRPNLITRLKGQARAPALLLYGHVDVVTTAGQEWTYPPFEGRIADGCVWGRGALDMKGGVAMMVSAILRAKARGLVPAGDIVLAILSDEEDGGDQGARFLVQDHAEQFAGIRYAIGEFGGFSWYAFDRKFYGIQIAEKQTCWMKATLRGEGGHGSQALRGGAMGKLGRMLDRLDRRRLPVHITPVARMMIERIAEALPFPRSFGVRQLLNPVLSDHLLRLLGERSRNIEPMLHNTVNVTIVRGGEKVNVIPSELVVELDGRLLPGFRPDDLISEIREVVKEDVEIEVLRYDPAPGEPDMGLFGTLADVLREADPEGVPVPVLLPGATDARFFSRLGIQSYGFLPMNLPGGFDFTRLVHAADERIPIACLDFGTAALYRTLERYGE